jgi:hypothetical protein
MLLSLRSVRLSVLLFASLALAAVASLAQAAPPSGTLLGVYAFENFRGLRITDTIPGYSAEGRLFAGDVLMQATTDGSDVFSIRTMAEFEFAKDQIGPNTPAAIEVFRPGVGRIYFWVEFMPVGGGAGVHAYSTDGPVAAAAAPRMKAQFKTEVERPGARALFSGGQGGGLGGGLQPAGGNSGFNGRPAVLPQRPMNGQGNPGSLFGN